MNRKLMFVLVLLALAGIYAALLYLDIPYKGLIQVALLLIVAIAIWFFKKK